MKTSKVLGAVALTAALAMGTVPAFAAGVDTNVNDFSVNVTDNEGGDTNPGKNYTGTGSTKVEATTYVVQMNVTVPIKMSVALPSTNGKIVFPDPNAYKITNNGTENITVTDVALKNEGANFALTSTTPDANNGSITAGGSTYDYYMKVGEYNAATSSLATNAALLKGSTSDKTNAVVEDLSWAIASGDALGLGWDGYIAYPNGALGTTDFNNQLINLANITWTVSATDVAVAA